MVVVWVAGWQECRNSKKGSISEKNKVRSVRWSCCIIESSMYFFVLHCNGSRRFEGSTRKLYLRRLRHRRWCAQFEFGSSIFLLFLVAADFWLKGKDSMWRLSLLRYPRTFGFVLKWDDKAWNRTEWRIAQPKITGWISWLLRLEKVSSSTKRRRRSTSWFEMRLVCTWPVRFINIRASSFQ